MILIDMEKLVQDVTKRRYTQASLDLIINQPVVPAIPIEWIKDKLSKVTDKEDNMSPGVLYVYALINEWRKENGQE